MSFICVCVCSVSICVHTAMSYEVIWGTHLIWTLHSYVHHSFAFACLACYVGVQGYMNMAEHLLVQLWLWEFVTVIRVAAGATLNTIGGGEREHN